MKLSEGGNMENQSEPKAVIVEEGIAAICTCTEEEYCPACFEDVKAVHKASNENSKMLLNALLENGLGLR
jgi:hypothetical protein